MEVLCAFEPWSIGYLVAILCCGLYDMPLVAVFNLEMHIELWLFIQFGKGGGRRFN